MGFDGVFERASARAVLDTWRSCAIAIAACVAIAACATATISADSSAEQKEAAVRKRVEARWAALIKGDVAGSYALVSPASRGVLSQQQYGSMIRKEGYRGMEIQGVKCGAETCDIDIIIIYDTKPIKGIRTPASEKWVLEQGQYWYAWPR